MSRKRPQLLEGWLGEQPKFNDLRMHTHSHRSPEFRVSGDNGVVIVIRTGIPLKVETRLFNSQNKNRNLSEYMLTQRKESDQIMFHLGFPENGFYMFQIFALDDTNPSDSLPNVYNYLIDADRVHRPAVPIAHGLTKFYDDYCYLEEPLAITNQDLNHVRFRLFVPGADQVAVNCGQEWFQLDRGRDRNEWEGTVNLYSVKGRNNKVSVAANYDRSSSTFHVLLDYKV